MSSSKISTLNDVIAVNLLFPIWTGRKTLSEGDLSLNGETPPKELISLGSKHTTDPAALKVFSKLKRRAERLCKTVGVGFMGGYAIPTNKADYINQQLHSIVNQFELEKADYISKHDAIQQEWIDSFPEYERVLRKAITNASDVENRINATFSMFRLQSVESEVTLSTGLERQVEQLSSTLDADILKEANTILHSLNKALKPCQTNVNSLKKLREKVEGLAFLNAKFNNLTAEIVKVEQQLSVVGNLTFDDQNKLSGLLYRMACPERLAELMQQVNSNQSLLAEIEKTESKQVDSYFDDSDYSFGDDPVVESESVLDGSDYTFDFDVANTVAVIPDSAKTLYF